MTENNLKKYLDDFFNELNLYDDYHNGHNYKGILKAGIDVFLEEENLYTAYEIYQTFFMIYQITPESKIDEKITDESIVSEPNTILDLVKIMKDYEVNTGDLIEKQRDHFVHSVNVFLLGLAIYSQNKKYRDIFKAYVTTGPYKEYYKINGELSHEEFFYRWGVASLLHDIGYPVEIIGKQLNKFINDGVKSISNSYNANTAIDFKDFNEFNAILKIDPNFADCYTNVFPEAKFLNLFKPTDIMAHKIATDFSNVDVNLVSRHLDSFVNVMGDSDFIDHGFFSAILVLNSYGFMIQKYAKDKVFFFYPIVDSASAILLHNYYRNVLQKDPFNLKALHPRQSPLAFLLILCDELQEWNREPYGVKDKNKGRVDDLLLDIGENLMDVEYVLRGGSMGLGFTDDKEELLYKVLHINSLFKKGLLVSVKLDHENSIIREIIKSEIPAPSVLLRNVEKLALEIHQQYIDTTTTLYEMKKASGELDDDLKEKYENLCEFKDLAPHFKISNIRQARSIPIKLNVIGCEFANKADKREAVTEFSEEEILDLARLEHEEWCEEKIGAGWTYGEVRDDDNRIHNYLVPWEDLPPEIQQYDIDPVKNIPHLVDSIGLKIVRTRIRMLTIEMHKFYSQGQETTTDFDDLPKYIRYSNYRQADFLVKILSEIGYDVVDKDPSKKAIDPFDENELEYLAKREHTAWFLLRLNSGWTHGEIRDDELRTNPNLVPWENLDMNIQEDNKRTFKNLPQLCDKVDLMIVKL
jgi:hypothetical protein